MAARAWPAAVRWALRGAAGVRGAPGGAPGWHRGLGSWDKLEGQVYGGGSPPKRGPRVTTRALQRKFAKGQPISMVTAYDYPSALHADMAGMDIILVGDSAGMVVQGYDTTLPVTLEEMLMHCRSVARGAQRPLLVGDMPFGSYEEGPSQAVRSAVRFMKEGAMDAVKLEGGTPARAELAKHIADAGIAVMGHTGLTPQAISVFGGFRGVGTTAREAESVFDQALALEDAGCFSVVLECVPAKLAAAISKALGIPTIGIGAGPHTGGQVLVYHDLLGIMAHPHHAKVTPSFVKRYGSFGQEIAESLRRYKEDVESRAFPSEEFSPYSMPKEHRRALESTLRQRGYFDAADALLPEPEEE